MVLCFVGVVGGGAANKQAAVILMIIVAQVAPCTQLGTMVGGVSTKMIVL